MKLVRHVSPPDSAPVATRDGHPGLGPAHKVALGVAVGVVSGLAVFAHGVPRDVEAPGRARHRPPLP